VKGGITLAIYIAIGITDAALGQLKAPSVFDYATAPVPISTNRPPSSDGWLPPDQRTPENVALQPKPPATAAAQESTHYKTPIDPEAGLPVYKRKYMPPDGSLDWLPEGARAVARLTALPRQPTERVVITYGPGGRVDEHNWKFGGYRNAGVEVEIRGGCLSACTLITAYVGKDKLCFASGAFLAFHAVRSLKGENMPASTGLMYSQQPADIRGWIDRTGGWKNLPLDGFWYLRDRELWEMGYPKCP
jgi:hypothetical protein